MYHCALCSAHVCDSGDFDRAPKNCPCLHEKIYSTKELYKQEENYKIARASVLVVQEGYCKKTRLEEIMDFAFKCGYKNLGLAFCIGLAKEAETISKVLVHRGFTINSVICKIGHLSKELIDMSNSPGSLCNPIGQATFLNEANTDLNILVGLCVGHDSLFIKYSKAPVTVFAVKDRVLCHNPLSMVYLADTYYKERLFPGT